MPTGIQNIEDTGSLTKPLIKNLFLTSWSPRITAKLNCDSEAIRQTSVYLHFKKSAPRTNKVATYFLCVRLFRCFQRNTAVTTKTFYFPIVGRTCDGKFSTDVRKGT